MSEDPRLRIPDNRKILHAPRGSVHIDAELHDKYPDIPPTVDVKLVRGKALVVHNPELKITRYVFGEGDKIETEILIADEIRTKLKKPVLKRRSWWRCREKIGGWGQVRALLEDTIGKVMDDPYGADSLDPRKSEEIHQQLRTINRVSETLERILGVPIAIKGTGKELPPGGRVWTGPHTYSEREDLAEQFLHMRDLGLRFQEKFTSDELKKLRIAPVFAYIRYPIEGPEEFQEWLLMERVEDAKELEEQVVMWTSGYRAGRESLVFDTEKHPRLAEFADNGELNKLYWTIANRLSTHSQDSSGHIGDLRGRNILVSGKKGKEQYTIIDVR